MNPTENAVPFVEVVVPASPPVPEPLPEEWADEVGLVDWDITVTPPPVPSQFVSFRFVEQPPDPPRVGEDLED